MQLPWIQVLNRGTQQIIQSVQAWFSQLGERQEDLSILKIPPEMDTEDRSLEELKDAALEMVGKWLDVKVGKYLDVRGLKVEQHDAWKEI